MEKWRGKVAVVTGASAGIGVALVKVLCHHGINVIGLARRAERVEELSNELKSAEGHLHSIKCDVSDQSSVKSAFEWIGKEFGGVDILINNAGVYKFVGLLDEGDEVTDELKKIIDVNLTGTMFCSRAALPLMKTRDFGYVININSINGHFIPFLNDNVACYNTYAPSKFGITAFSEVLRQELASNSELKDKIRCTSLSPGEVKTDMVEVSGYKGSVDGYFASVPTLKPEDIAEAVVYILSTPTRVNVTELTIRPTGEKV